MNLTFEPPDRETFPALDLAFAAGRSGRSAPAVLNAADEMAVEAFLQRRLGFLGISEVVERTLERSDFVDLETVDDVVAADREARALARELIGGVC
jgi:1-deoxy-D-xylulose-5-phosphate reductoisomerase